MTLWPWYIYHSGPGIVRIPKISSFWKSDQFFCTFRREVPFGNDPMTLIYISFWSWYLEDSKDIFLLKIGPLGEVACFFPAPSGGRCPLEMTLDLDIYIILVLVSWGFQRHLPFENRTNFSAPSGGRCPLEMTLWPWYIYHSGPGIVRIPKISSFWKSDQFFCTFRREVPFGNDPMTLIYISFWSWYREDSKDIFLLKIGPIV